ncbi:MAG: helix-turn-helix transcriptional regulator [Alcanivoracaceae bacterium]|nr:helix-turn-helix transcriptional regulator [Alcanivoracaceae bacterium]
MHFTEQQQHHLLDRLYLAPFEKDGWQTFLADLVQACDSRSARLLTLNANADRVYSSVQVNTDAKAHQAYVDYYVNHCPWRPELAQKEPGQLYSTFLDFSCNQQQFYRSEFFNDWARPQNIHHGACGTAGSYQDLNFQLLVQRTGDQGHFDRNVMSALNGLLPHVRRALHIEALHWQQRCLRSAREQQHNCAAMMLLDEQGRVAFMSEEAQAYFCDGGAIGLRDSAIYLRHAATQQSLMSTISEVLNARLAHAGNVINVERAGQSDLRLLVMPVHPDATENPLFPTRAFAAVFIIDIESEVHIDEHLLAQLLGLTAAEARNASAVARGMSPAELARAFNVSIHTARSQLKSVFRKTGTSSQSQLSSLILNSPAAQRGPRGNLSSIADRIFS